MRAKKKASPMHYKTGKVRLGPLSLKQLNDMLEKSSKSKEKARIRNRIATLEKRKAVLKP